MAAKKTTAKPKKPKQELVPKDEAPVPGAEDRPGRKRGQAARTDQQLTIEQEAYCRCRAMGMSQEEALAKSEIRRTLSTVRKWESHSALIRARINELSQMATDKAIERTGLNREWVLQRLMTVVDRCMQAEVVLDHEGNPTGEYQFDSRGANGALKMLGDSLGMFKLKPQAPGEDLEQLSDEDIARIAADLAAQTGLVGYLAGAKTPA